MSQVYNAIGGRRKLYKQLFAALLDSDQLSFRILGGSECIKDEGIVFLFYYLFQFVLEAFKLRLCELAFEH